jgi:hypothetical protein
MVSTSSSRASAFSHCGCAWAALRTGIHVLLAMPVREAGMTSVIFFLVVCAAGIAAAVAAIKVVGWFQVEVREYRRDALQRDRRRNP